MHENKRRHVLLAVACVLGQSMVYGIGNPLTKVAYESITPFLFLSFRYWLATAVLGLLRGRGILRDLKAGRPGEYLPAGLCLSGAYISCNLALSFTSSTNVGFLMSLPVLFTPVLALLLLHQKYERRLIPVQLLVLLGLVLLCAQEGSLTFGKGEAWGLATAFFISGSLVYARRALNSHIGPVTIAFVQTGTAAVLSTLCAVVFDDLSIIPRIQPAAWLVVMYVALFCSCLAYVLQNRALVLASPALVSMVQCTQPILTAVFSYLLLKERLSATGLAGAVLILGGTVLGSLLESRTQAQAF